MATKLWPIVVGLATVASTTGCKYLGPFKEASAAGPHAEVVVSTTFLVMPKKETGIFHDVRLGPQRVEEVSAIPWHRLEPFESGQSFPPEVAPRWSQTVRVPVGRESLRFRTEFSGSRSYTVNRETRYIFWTDDQCDVDLSLDAKAGHRYRIEYVFAGNHHCTLTCHDLAGGSDHEVVCER